MDFLKDKKNLPIVVALAVFVMLGAGGLIAFELGLFSPSSSAPTPPVIARTGPGAAGGAGAPAFTGTPLGMPRGVPSARTAAAGAVPGAAVAKKPVLVNPLVGSDPFKIPNGAVVYQKSKGSLIAKTPLRDVIGPLDLFQLRPPPPPVVPIPSGGSATTGLDPSGLPRLIGIAAGTDGINAILQIGDQSQTVKPGDSLPDGTQVQNIQSTSITLRTTSGTVVNLPLSAGAPQTAPNFNGQNFNGQNNFNNQQYQQPNGGQFAPQGQG